MTNTRVGSQPMTEQVLKHFYTDLPHAQEFEQHVNEEELFSSEVLTDTEYYFTLYLNEIITSLKARFGTLTKGHDTSFETIYRDSLSEEIVGDYRDQVDMFNAVVARSEEERETSLVQQLHLNRAELLDIRTGLCRSKNLLAGSYSAKQNAQWLGFTVYVRFDPFVKYSTGYAHYDTPESMSEVMLFGGGQVQDVTGVDVVPPTLLPRISELPMTMIADYCKEGLSPAEAFDFLAHTVFNKDIKDIATSRGREYETVRKNIRSAEEKFNENRRSAKEQETAKPGGD